MIRRITTPKSVEDCDIEGVVIKRWCAKHLSFGGGFREPGCSSSSVVVRSGVFQLELS